MRSAALFLVLSALLAGCTSSSHDGMHRQGLSLLLGVENDSAETIEAGWTVSVAANATIVWANSETLEPAQKVERIQGLFTQGVHDVLLSWGAAHEGRTSFDTAACAGTTHLVLALHANGTFTETTRECHE